MLFDAYGRPATRTVETLFPPRLVQLLVQAAEADFWGQNGIIWVCAKCRGVIQGQNRPESDDYRLTCGCATRIIHKKTDRERVLVH